MQVFSNRFNPKINMAFGSKLESKKLKLSNAAKKQPLYSSEERGWRKKDIISRFIMIAGISAFCVLKFGPGIEDFISKHTKKGLEEQIVNNKNITPDKAEAVFTKAKLIGNDKERSYMRQWLDSVNGGKSTPEKTFETDKLVFQEKARLEKQIDSLESLKNIVVNIQKSVKNNIK